MSIDFWGSEFSKVFSDRHGWGFSLRPLGTAGELATGEGARVDWGAAAQGGRPAGATLPSAGFALGPLLSPVNAAHSLCLFFTNTALQLLQGLLVHLRSFRHVPPGLLALHELLARALRHTLLCFLVAIVCSEHSQEGEGGEEAGGHGASAWQLVPPPRQVGDPANLTSVLSARDKCWCWDVQELMRSGKLKGYLEDWFWCVGGSTGNSLPVT